MTTRLPTDECIDQAMYLFAQMHGCPSFQTAERLVSWLGEADSHVQALDMALTDLGLVVIGQPTERDLPPERRVLLSASDA